MMFSSADDLGAANHL